MRTVLPRMAVTVNGRYGKTCGADGRDLPAVRRATERSMLGPTGLLDVARRFRCPGAAATTPPAPAAPLARLAVRGSRCAGVCGTRLLGSVRRLRVVRLRGLRVGMMRRAGSPLVMPACVAALLVATVPVAAATIVPIFARFARRMLDGLGQHGVVGKVVRELEADERLDRFQSLHVVFAGEADRLAGGPGACVRPTRWT
jgi:hypothetical protein